MKDKVIEKYLRKALGEHFAYMPKGEYKVDSSRKAIKFTFNPARVSRKFIEACTDKNGLYKYIKESTSKKVVMELPLDESKEDESMMTPTGLTFTGKRTLQCDEEGKEVLREKIDPNEDEDFRYHISLYYDENRRGLEDEFQTDDYDVVEEYVWDYIQKGSYITVWDQETMRRVDLDPDDYDQETDDLYNVLDDLKKVSPLNSDNTDEEWAKKAFTAPLGTESLTEEVEEEPTEDEEELELNIDEEDEEESNISERYAELDQKTVYDSDGFMTDYTLYRDNETDRFVCILGDQDFYSPDDSEPDAEFEREAEAYEWFNSYEGMIDEIDEDEDWETRTDRFDDIESPYYNGDLEDSDFEDDESDEELELKVDEEEVEEESLQLKTESSNISDFMSDGQIWDYPDGPDYPSFDPEEAEIVETVNFDIMDKYPAGYKEGAFVHNIKDLELYDDENTLVETIDAETLATTIYEDFYSDINEVDDSAMEGLPFDTPFRVTGTVEITYKYPYYDEYDNYGEIIGRDYKLEDKEVDYKFSNVKVVPLTDDELKEDYWFGGNGKLDIPERDNLQPGDDQFELRVDDVTKDNEDQNAEEQEEELNEDYLPSEFYTVRFCRVDGEEDEIYEYKDLKDAEYHFNLFDDNDADIYTRITIEDPSGKVIDEKKFVSEGLNRKNSEVDRLKYSVELIKDDGTSEVHSFANYKSAKNLYDQYDETDGYVKVKLIGNKGIWDTLEEKDFTISESIEKEKKVSFKDKHICQGCGKPLSQCTCEIKEEDLKEGATQDRFDIIDSGYDDGGRPWSVDKQELIRKYRGKGYTNVAVRRVPTDTKGLRMYTVYGEKGTLDEATQPSNIGQHKMSSIDLIEETDSEDNEGNNAEDSEMIKSLDNMINKDKSTEK